jgi:hypothetical protein
MSLFDLFDDEDQQPTADQGWDFGGIPQATTPAPAATSAPAPASAPPSDGWDFGDIPAAPRRPTYAAMADQLHAAPSTPIAGTVSGSDVFAQAPAPTPSTPPETTALAPDQEAAFQQWAQASGIGDVDHPDSHYDYRGLFLAVHGQPIPMSADRHFPDTFKQHGHPTFSVESQYSTGPYDGGTWNGEEFVPPPVMARSRTGALYPQGPPSQGVGDVIGALAQPVGAALGVVTGNLTNIPTAVGESLAGQTLPGHEGETTLQSRLANHARMILTGRGNAVAPMSIPGAMMNPPNSTVGPQTIVTEDGAAQVPTQVRGRSEMVALETGRRGLDMAAKLLTDPTAIAAMGVPGTAGELLANAFAVEGVTAAAQVVTDPKATPEDVAEAVVGAAINAVPAAARVIRPKVDAVMQQARVRAAERIAREKAEAATRGFENARPVGKGTTPLAGGRLLEEEPPTSQGPPLTQEPPPSEPPAAVRPGEPEAREPGTQAPVPSPGESPAAPVTPVSIDTPVPRADPRDQTPYGPATLPGLYKDARVRHLPSGHTGTVVDWYEGPAGSGRAAWRVQWDTGETTVVSNAMDLEFTDPEPKPEVAAPTSEAPVTPALPEQPSVGNTAVTDTEPAPVSQARTPEDEADDILRELEAERGGKLHQESADSDGPRWHPDSTYAQVNEEDNDPQSVLDLVKEEQTARLYAIARLKEAITATAPKGHHKKLERLQKDLQQTQDEYDGTWDEIEHNMLGVDWDATRAGVEQAAAAAAKGESDAVPKPGTTPVDARDASANGEGVGRGDAGGREAAGTPEAETAGPDADHPQAQAGSLNERAAQVLKGATHYKPMLPNGATRSPFIKQGTPVGRGREGTYGFDLAGKTVTSVTEVEHGVYDIQYTSADGIKGRVHVKTTTRAPVAELGGLKVGDRVTKPKSRDVGVIREFIEHTKRGPRAWVVFTEPSGNKYEQGVDLPDLKLHQENAVSRTTPVTPAAPIPKAHQELEAREPQIRADIERLQNTKRRTSQESAHLASLKLDLATIEQRREWRAKDARKAEREQTPVTPKPEKPAFKVGDKVKVDEGAGEILFVRDGNVKIALRPGGALTNWIPASRVTRDNTDDLKRRLESFDRLRASLSPIHPHDMTAEQKAQMKVALRGMLDTRRELEGKPPLEKRTRDEAINDNIERALGGQDDRDWIRARTTGLANDELVALIKKHGGLGHGQSSPDSDIAFWQRGNGAIEISEQHGILSKTIVKGADLRDRVRAIFNIPQPEVKAKRQTPVATPKEQPRETPATDDLAERIKDSEAIESYKVLQKDKDHAVTRRKGWAADEESELLWAFADAVAEFPTFIDTLSLERLNALVDGIARVLADPEDAGLTEGALARENVEEKLRALDPTLQREILRREGQDEFDFDGIAKASRTPVTTKDETKYDAAARGKAYDAMTDDELRELLDIGVGEEPNKAAAEITRRAVAERQKLIAELKKRRGDDDPSHMVRKGGTPRRRDWRASLQTSPFGPIFNDARLTPEELADLAKDPAVLRLAAATKVAIDDVLRAFPSVDAAIVKRGVVFSENVIGVYVSDVTAGADEHGVYVNPFESARMAKQTPQAAASALLNAILHEITHATHRGARGERFAYYLGVNYGELGGTLEGQVLGRLMAAYRGGGLRGLLNRTRLAPDVAQTLLRLESLQRGRSGKNGRGGRTLRYITRPPAGSGDEGSHPDGAGGDRPGAVTKDDVVALIKILDTYKAEGITDFAKAIRQFQDDYGSRARTLDRAFEIAWRNRFKEEKKVGDVLGAAHRAREAGEADRPAAAEAAARPHLHRPEGAAAAARRSCRRQDESAGLPEGGRADPRQRHRQGHRRSDRRAARRDRGCDRAGDRAECAGPAAEGGDSRMRRRSRRGCRARIARSKSRSCSSSRRRCRSPSWRRTRRSSRPTTWCSSRRPAPATCSRRSCRRTTAARASSRWSSPSVAPICCGRRATPSSRGITCDRDGASSRPSSLRIRRGGSTRPASTAAGSRWASRHRRRRGAVRRQDAARPRRRRPPRRGDADDDDRRHELQEVAEGPLCGARDHPEPAGELRHPGDVGRLRAARRRQGEGRRHAAGGRCRERLAGV